MKILVLAATHSEIQPLLTHFHMNGKNIIIGNTFDVCISGVGIAATSFALGRQLNKVYSMVLNLGIAGSFDRSLSLGTVVNVTKDTFSELGAEDDTKFRTLTEMGFGEVLFTGKQLDSLPNVDGVTVNTVHGNAGTIAKIIERFNPTVESMEGAAVFYSCQMLNIPCLQIRALSNYVERRDASKWNINLAVENLNNWAIDYLKSL